MTECYFCFCIVLLELALYNHTVGSFSVWRSIATGFVSDFSGRELGFHSGGRGRAVGDRGGGGA
jgi:hypothetical protein